MWKIGLWCNGNTTDSGPVFPGSNPGSPTRGFPHFGESLFCARWLVPGRCENGILFPNSDFSKKLLHLSCLIVSLLKTSLLCPEGCTGHLSAEGVCIPYGRRERLFLKRAFFLRQTIFQSQPNDFSICAKRFSNVKSMFSRLLGTPKKHSSRPTKIPT